MLAFNDNDFSIQIINHLYLIYLLLLLFFFVAWIFFYMLNQKVNNNKEASKQVKELRNHIMWMQAITFLRSSLS